MRSELRPHQQRALDMLRASLASGRRRPMLQAATGFGKTICAAAMVEGALAKGKRVVFTAPAVTLIDQTVERFAAEGIRDIGVMQASHPMTAPHRPVQIASVQTLERRHRPECDLVIVDEAHRDHKAIREWMAARPDVVFVGLSATPWTKGLGRHYDDLLIPCSTAELIEAGYLSPFRVYAPATPDLTGVKTVAGEYHEGQLGEAMSDKQLVADTVATWVEKADGLPTLCFAVNRAHARHLFERFASAGVSVAYVDADTPLVERAEIGRKLAGGSIQVVVNIGTLTTGVDWDVRCIVLARPTKSLMLHVQIVGRGLRTAPGKRDCLVLDHAGNHLRLGLVTDIHRDRLCDGKPATASSATKEPEPKLPKECGSCGALKPPGLRVCGFCGHEASPPVKGVDEADGELVEIGAGGKRKKSREATPEEKARWYRSLLWICEERGYRKGWAANQYREKFGVWPRGVEGDAIEPSPEIRAWVRSRQIRFSKGRARGQANAA